MDQTNIGSKRGKNRKEYKWLQLAVLPLCWSFWLQTKLSFTMQNISFFCGTKLELYKLFNVLLFEVKQCCWLAELMLAGLYSLLMTSNLMYKLILFKFLQAFLFLWCLPTLLLWYFQQITCQKKDKEHFCGQCNLIWCNIWYCCLLSNYAMLF